MNIFSLKRDIWIIMIFNILELVQKYTYIHI